MANRIEIIIDSVTTGLEKGLSSSSGGLARFSKATMVAGTALAAGLAVGLTKSVKAAAEFQSSMELIQTQAGASTKEVDSMSKALVGMAADVGQTPNELAKGLFHVESAGFRGAKALNVLRLAAEGAAVGHTDLESTTNALVAAQHSGIKGMGDMTHAMGVLNSIVGAGNMRMEDLTSALGTGLAVKAKGFGASIQDVGTALAVMTRNGVPAVNAATGIGMAMAAIGAPTKQAIGVLKGLGITQLQLANDLRSRGLIAAARDLKTHMVAMGKSAAEQAQVIASVFGRKSATAILTLIQNLKEAGSVQDAITAGSHNFAANWEETQRTSEFATLRFKAAVSALEVEIGTALLPTVTGITNQLSVFAQYLSQHEALTRRLIIALAALAATLISVRVATMLVVAAMRIATAATKIWAAGQWLLNAALTANPIGVVIVAIAALAAGIIVAYRHSATFRAIVTGALNAVSAAADYLKAHWQLMVAILAGPEVLVVIKNLHSIARAVETVYGWIASTIHAIEGLISALGRIHVPHISLPHIGVPHFAGGVKSFSGGMALVGEKGPELVNLPGGSSVTPNGAMGGTIVFNFPNYVGDKRELMSVIRSETQRLRSRGGDF